MNHAVKARFDEYPKHVRIRIEELRNIVLTIASELKLGDRKSVV